jgi:hypothetical protein
VTSQAQLSRLLAHYQLLRPPVTPGQPSDTDDAVSMIVTTGVPTVLSFFPSGANPTIRYGLATWYEWVFGVEITLTPAFAYPAAGPADIPLTVGICDIVLAASSVYNSDVGCTVRVIGETNPAKGATVRLVILPCDTTGNGTQHYLPIARNTGINLTVGVPPPLLTFMYRGATSIPAADTGMIVATARLLTARDTDLFEACGVARLLTATSEVRGPNFLL